MFNCCCRTRCDDSETIVSVGPSAAATEARKREQHLQHALDSRIVIEQAKGMLAEHAGIDMPSAFNRIRARARNTNSKLTVVATRIVDGHLDLDALSVDRSNAV